MIRAAEIKITGRVQGVFFRAMTEKKARELQLKGFVRNRADGSVEILAQGRQDDIIKLIKWCESSPGFAKTDNAEVKWKEPIGNLKDFVIKYD